MFCLFRYCFKQIVESFNSITLDLTAREAVNETWELASWILTKLLGSVHAQDLQKICASLSAWAESETGDLISRLSPDNLAALVNTTASIVGTLKGGVGKRQKNPVVTHEVLAHSQERAKAAAKSSLGASSTSSKLQGGGLGSKPALKKSVSTGFLAGLSDGVGEGGDGVGGKKLDDGKKKFAKLQPFRKEFILADNLRDKVCNCRAWMPFLA